jgi:lipoprotein-anchoring transpeptidase ErfK/SrfK
MTSWSHKTPRLSRLPPLPGGISKLMAQGVAAGRAGKKAEARYCFRAVLDLAPDHPAALLWLAYLAGGGRPSLTYLVRLLELDPTNERARAAIRWARARANPQAAAPVLSPVPRPSGRREHPPRLLLALAVLVLAVASGLATVAFVLDHPVVMPTRAKLLQLVAAVALDTSEPTPSATPTQEPRPTASPSPLPSATATATATTAPTATEVSSPTATPSPLPSLTPTATAVPPTSTPPPTAIVPPTQRPTVPIGGGFRWIDVDLSNQRLIAYEGETPVRWVTVSTGLPRTPTVTGRFKVYVKYRAADMSGPGYYLRQVPYVMYFYRGYGLHGTYWHSNFGRPMSHGCVNLPTPEAQWLFNWASVGTPVVVHY